VSDGGNLRSAGEIAALRAAERARVAPLFAGLDWHLAVPAVLAGQAAGAVYADSAAAPRSGLLLAGHRAYLAGDPGNGAFLAAVRPVLERRFIRAGWEMGAFTLYYDHPDWPVAAETALSAGLKDYQAWRLCHYLKDQRTEPETTAASGPPEGFRLAAVDASLVDDPALENKEALLEEMCSERESPTDFLARSFGLALLHENAVAGWCLSEYNLGHRCEVGIAVDQPFRRRGLATLLGRAFAQQALAAGVSEIGWHCLRDNAASCATARALGFTLMHEYPAHWVGLSHAPAPS
jgi:RimJ/RimL family protein N-acetyltransferase